MLAAVSWLVLTAVACAGNVNDARRKALVRSIEDAVRPLKAASPHKPVMIARYKDLVTTSRWKERWPGEGGDMKTVAVTAEIWTAAIQACLDKHDSVRVPHRDKPYYIDAPLVLKTGNHLAVESGTEMRLKPGSNTCMVRNRHVVDGQHGAVVLGAGADADITIEGGIWSTLATTVSEYNGNVRGGSVSSGRPLGSHGTIMISNARRVVVRDLTIKQCRPHGVQIGNCSVFLVENIVFENHGRDGVHMGGPARNGVVRNIRGDTGDDMIAINAWDWKQSNTTFGPIERILVDNVVANKPSAVRLLAGTKTFGGGKSVACDIDDCVIRNIRGMHEIKIYDQPNLEKGRDVDFADPIGQLAKIFFNDIHVGSPTPPMFQIASNVDGIDISDVTLDFDPRAGDELSFHLVEVGPMSMTYKHNRNNPATWVEVFSPDKDCTVRRLTISNVHFDSSKRPTRKQQVLPNKEMVHVRNQKPNSDYPKTTPRGGHGRGILIRK